MTQRQTKKTNLPAVPHRASTKPTNGDLVTGFELPALSVVQSYARSSVSPEEIVASLRDHAKHVNEGDLTLVESMLLSQAIALQNMFSDLATRAAGQSTMQGKQVLTQLALKAQSNARATLQTLVEAKSPKQIAFVKQTNVAQTQQVNNGSASPPAPARARKTKKTPNKLKAEDKNGSTTLDGGATTRPGKTNQGDAAVAVVLRSEN